MSPRRRIGQIAYRDYLASPHWRSVRACYWKHRQRSEFYCRGCGDTSCPLDLHHNHYRSLGREQFADLTPLCRACHDDVHRIARWPGQTLETALAMVKARARKRG